MEQGGATSTQLLGWDDTNKKWAPTNTGPVSGVSANTYGSATQSAVLVVDVYGRITSASNVTITGASGGTPSEELITETALVGTAASVSFTSIAGSYRDLRVVVRGRGDKAATFVEVRLRVNNDSGSNYDFESIVFNNTTSSSGGTAATTYGFLGWIEASTGPASAGSTCEARIYDYASTTFQKHFNASAGVKTGTAAGNFFSHRGDLWWRSTAAINRVDVFPDSGNFIAGTVVTLYGIH